MENLDKYFEFNKMALVESLGCPKIINNAAFVCNCLATKSFIRNYSLTSGECKTESRLQKGDMYTLFHVSRTILNFNRSHLRI